MAGKAEGINANTTYIDKRAIREVVTPEGVALRLQLADRGERAVAVILDLVFIFLSIIALVIGIVLFVGGFGGGSVFLPLVILISFAFRSFYFMFFELRWHGQTPGKRILGIRVVSRSGGSLQADAIIVRNLMRELELFLPMTLLLGGGGYGDEAWASLLSILWACVFLFLPFFNKDRLRAGDIVAGTWVIATPKSALLPDVADDRRDGIGGRDVQLAAQYRFTRKQLGAYGIYELQTLEHVLRQKGPDSRNVRAVVAERIGKKIGWEGPEYKTEPEAFLQGFYTALRQHLETKMLFGVKRRSKHDKEKGGR